MDYKQLGLRIGLEIHQQLEGKKLFCGCPTIINDNHPDFEIQRKLRAVAGESGEIDIAALQEQTKDRSFIYQGYYDHNCLVETDSEPPHEINQDSLYTTLQFCTLINANISPVVQVMRKIVVDGSNTSGFQRTALISRKGKIKTEYGKVSIANLSLEEDACRIISETAEEKIYRLDRLGIPLIEIGTNPDINSPEGCLEAAKKIGMLLRSLKGVKRGLGTIRQDVNISIKGGERIEIKGAQELKQLPLLVELEVKRQAELLRLRQELKSKKLNPFKIIDVTSSFAECESKIIKETLKNNGKILAIKLNHFSGFIKRELQPNHRLGTEFSERAKIKAGVSGIFHSDELPKYGIEEKEVNEVHKRLKCAKEDAFILVAEKKDTAEKALEAVYERAKEVFIGVPKEVRKANADGTTSFLRPIPGADRMYPETDVPLVYPNLTNIELPELLEEKILRFQKELGLSKDLATLIARSDKVLLFEELLKKYPQIKPSFIAETMTSSLLEIKRNYQQDPGRLSDNDFKDLFRCLSENKIHKDIIIDVLIDMINNRFDENKYASLGTEDIHRQLLEIIRKNPNAPFPALMGMAMKQLAGKASGKFISEALKKILDTKNK